MRTSLALFLLVLLSCSACRGLRRRVVPEWQATIAWTAPAKLGGCAVGELAPRAAGEEIVAVSITGEIHLLQRSGLGWAHSVLARTPGELIQCDVGDADPSRPGNEILAVGMKAGSEEDGGPGMAWLLVDSGGPTRTLVPLLEDDALLHGGCIADVDPDRPGAEIVVAGFAQKVHVLSHDGAGYLHQVVCTLDGPAKQVVGWRGGAAVACANGDLVFVHKEDGAWKKELVATAEVGLARLGARGDRIAVARDDGALWLVAADGAESVIHAEEQKLRGAVLADLDPDRPGFEAATAGYEGRITVLTAREDAGWDAVVVYQEEARFHHLTAGEVDAAGIGFELVGCGYSGNVIVVRMTKVVH